MFPYRKGWCGDEGTAAPHMETEGSSLTPDVRIFPLDKVSREGRCDSHML